MEKDLELENEELQDEELDECFDMDIDDETEEDIADEEALARRAKRKKRILIIAGIALGLAIAATLALIIAKRNKED